MSNQITSVTKPSPVQRDSAAAAITRVVLQKSRWLETIPKRLEHLEYYFDISIFSLLASTVTTKSSSSISPFERVICRHVR